MTTITDFKKEYGDIILSPQLVAYDIKDGKFYAVCETINSFHVGFAMGKIRGVMIDENIVDEIFNPMSYYGERYRLYDISDLYKEIEKYEKIKISLLKFKENGILH